MWTWGQMDRCLISHKRENMEHWTGVSLGVGPAGDEGSSEVVGPGPAKPDMHFSRLGAPQRCDRWLHSPSTIQQQQSPTPLRRVRITHGLDRVASCDWPPNCHRFCPLSDIIYHYYAVYSTVQLLR